MSHIRTITELKMSGPRIGTLSGSGGGGRGAQPAAGNPGAPGGPPQNWLQEWQGRTPFVTRWAIYITLPLSLLCLLWEAAYNALSNSPRTFLAFELWRPITALPNSGSALDLPFTLLMLAMTGPSTERALGSTRFASFLGAFGVIINFLYAGIMVSPAGPQLLCRSLMYSFPIVLHLQQAAEADPFKLRARSFPFSSQRRCRPSSSPRATVQSPSPGTGWAVAQPCSACLACGPCSWR